MTNKDETKCFIKCSDGKRIVTLRITEEYLVQEWNCGSDVARRHWNLKNLSPMLDYSQGRGKDFTLYGIITIAVLALSVCLFFSSLNRYVPLLSPFVGIAGLFLFYKTIEHGKVRKWTIFQNHDGRTATYITHKGCSEEDITRFTECFVEAVKNANDRVE